MFTRLRTLILIVAILFSSGIYTSAQPADREFGWSLKVEPAERRNAGSHPIRNRVPAAGSEEIRVDTELVLSGLLVQDKKGTPILGLSAADFEISESGSPQKIDVFAYGDASIPRSIVLVIDHSLSQLRHIDMSVASAK